MNKTSNTLNSSGSAFNRPWPKTYPEKPKPINKKRAEKLPIPRGPRTKKIGDNLYDLAKHGLKFLIKIHENYGDSASFYVNGKLYIALFAPEMVYELYTSKQNSFIKGYGFQRVRKVLGDGILTSEGEVHLNDRRMIQPAFHKEKINSYIEEIYSICKTHVDAWPEEGEIQLAPEMMSLTLKIVSQTLFGADSLEYEEELHRNLDIAVDRAALTVLPSFSALDNSGLPWFKDYKKAAENLTNITKKIIEKRRKENIERNDLLGMLLSTTKANGEKLTEEEIIDQSLTILISGHETESVLLTWAIARIGTQEKIRRQLQQSLCETSWIKEERAPSLTELGNNELLESAIKETLRVNPPLWLIMRQAIEDVTICGVFIPKGTQVVLSPYITHRNSKIFTKPGSWDPSRWNDNFEKTLPKGSYFPFSYGVRKCIGDQMAMTEARVILSYILSRYIVQVDKSGVPKVNPRTTLRAEGPVPSKIKRIATQQKL